MNPLYAILGLVAVLILLLAVLVAILLAVQSRIDPAAYKELQKLRALMPKQQKKRSWILIASRLYPFLLKIPIAREVLSGLRKRLRALYADNEMTIRTQAASIALVIAAVVSLLWLMAFLFVSSWLLRMGIVLAALYIGGVVADLLIGRREKKLLYDLSGLLLDLRHEYHQTHMVMESLERASERTSLVVSAHARKIAEVLGAVDPEGELQKYYDEAPNRYMKLLAGISHMVSENGDGTGRKGERSLYLNALAKINEEIRLDILRRERLDAQLAGIVFVAFSPLFFIEPLRNWGEGYFPSMGDYYNSGWGLYSLLILYLLVIGGFVGLRLVRGLDGASRRGAEDTNGFAKWRKTRWFRGIAGWLTPSTMSSSHFRASKQIKDANAALSVRELYVQKWMLAVVAFLLLVVFQLHIHSTVRERIVDPPIRSIAPEAAATSEDYYAGQRLEYESEVIREALKLDIPEAGREAFVREKLRGKPFLPRGPDAEKYPQTVVDKIATYKQEYFRWYELLIAFAVACLVYVIPNALLFFRRSMRKWEMQNETDGFTAIVSILSGLPRISVIEMLDWMHRYSHIFERQLLRCLIDFESGPWQALERLKEECRFLPMERLTDRLQVAAELIPVKQAFDDIEQERAFELEQRKLQYEQIINKKISIGKMIGFLPLQATFALYLMIPFGYMAFMQLGELSDVTGGL